MINTDLGKSDYGTTYHCNPKRIDEDSKSKKRKYPLTRGEQPAQGSQHQQGIARSQRKTSYRKRRHVNMIISTEELLTNNFLN